MDMDGNAKKTGDLSTSVDKGRKKTKMVNVAQDLASVPATITTEESRYKRLEAVYKLQKRLVQENMHKAMSPVSAISGYLELMRMFLDQEEVDKEKLEAYRKKIEEGMAELSEIIEELHRTFKEQEDQVNEGEVVLSENKMNRAS
jgi:signal transduction histidine kinase